MSDINAAIGLAQLDDLPLILTRRREMLQYYDSHLTESYYVKLNRRSETKSLYLYPIILNNRIDRESVIKYMNSKEIEVGIHYPPIHLEPIIDSPPLLPITQYLNQHLITLPFHNNLSDDDLKYVVDALDSYPGV
jgi:perosamine synthetase